MENTKDQCLLVCHLLSHKAGPLCCFTCLNICFTEITRITGVCVRHVLVWVSDPFSGTPVQAVFSPWLSAPFPACCGYVPHALDPKKGRERFYFKTDLFYAFIMKANLLSNVQCLHGLGRSPEETRVTAFTSGLPPPAPRPRLPPTAHRPVCGGLVWPRASPRGTACSRKSWSKDVVTLSALDDPLWFSGRVSWKKALKCVHTSAPTIPPSPASGWGAGSFVAAGATHECQCVP